MPHRLLPAVLLLLTTLPTLAQEKGLWRASSTTARSITGDIGFGNEKLIINFLPFTLAEIRALTPAEISAAFNPDDPAAGAGHLFRTSIPGDRKFLHKNTICGTEETQWVVTFVQDRTLHLAFFSGNSMPTLTPDALNAVNTLCGTYTFTR